MKPALDWLARTAIVALSMVATLSIIGSIAAIPSGSIEQRLGMEIVEQSADPLSRVEREPVAAPNQREVAVPAKSRETDIATPPSQPRNPLEPWLESITYALIAIAALLGAGVFMLWRALGHWRRLADAAEDRI